MRILLAFLLFLPFTVLAQCDTVTNLTATSIGSSNATISFTTPSESVYFVLIYSDGVTTHRQNINNPGSPYPHLVTSPISGLTQSTDYTFTIVRYCTITDSVRSSDYYFTTLTGQCDTVTNVISSTTSSTALITSSEATYGESYRIKYVKQGYTDTLEQTGDDADFSLSGLRPNSIYYYQITTFCSGSDSIENSFRTFQTRNSPAYTPLSNYGNQVKRFLAYGVLNYPAISGEPSTTIDGKNDYPSILQDTSGQLNYYFNPRTQQYFTEAVDVVNNIAELKAHKLTSKRVFVKDSCRGGNFNLIYDNALSDDGGVYFKADSLPNGYFWAREIADSKSYNLKWWGALGNGLSSLSEDSAALCNSINFIRTRNGGSLYIPKAPQYYAYCGNGILLPSNTEVYGDGNASEIKNVNPDAGATYRGVIFYTTSYGSNDSCSIIVEGTAPIHDAAIGDTTIIVDNTADLDSVIVGHVYFFGAYTYAKGPNMRYAFGEQNRIIKISGDTLFLEYPLSSQLSTIEGQSPVLVKINSGAYTSTVVPGTLLQTTEHLSVHDLKLTQASYNMVDSIPLVKGLPHATIQLGGTYESNFYNLTMVQYTGGVNGNMWGRCNFNNITMHCKRHFIDVGYNSNNTDFNNVHMLYQNNNAADIEVSLMYINEGSHHIRYNNISADGNWNGRNIMGISGGAHDIIVKNAFFTFDVLQNDNYGISIDDEDSVVYSHHITLDNIKVHVDTIGQFLRIIGNSHAPRDRYISLSNMTFEGALSGYYGQKATIQTVGSISLDNITFPSTVDSINLQTLSKAYVTGLKASNAYVATTGTGTGDLNLSDLQVAATNVTSLRLNGAYRKVYGSSASTYTGVDAGADDTGLRNTISGRNAARFNTTGNDNTVNGQGALYGTAGMVINATTAIGSLAGNRVNTGADSSIYIGYKAGYGVKTGTRNVFIGSWGKGLDSNVVNIRNALIMRGVRGDSDSTTAVNDSSFRLGLAVLNPVSRFDMLRSTTLRASGNIPAGYVPSSPRTGDFWRDTTDGEFYMRVGSTTTKVTNQAIMLLGGSFASTNTVAASTTLYNTMFGSYANFAAENVRQWVCPVSGTIRNLYVSISTAQPASGSLVLTVRKNATDQVLTVTIAANATAGIYSDLTHSFTVSAGDVLSISAVNNATGTSAPVISISAAITKN